MTPQERYKNFMDSITDKQFYDQFSPQYKWICKKVVEERWDGHEDLAAAINAEEKNYMGIMDFMSYYMRFFENERVNDQFRKIIGARGKHSLKS